MNKAMNNKKRPPAKVQSLKFSCAGFTIWVTGDKRTISIGVSEILAGFKHQDEFCTIDSEQRLKLKKESIEIGTVGQRHYSILLSECDYSFWELCEYFKALCEGDE